MPSRAACLAPGGPLATVLYATIGVAGDGEVLLGGCTPPGGFSCCSGRIGVSTEQGADRGAPSPGLVLPGCLTASAPIEKQERLRGWRGANEGG